VRPIADMVNHESDEPFFGHLIHATVAEHRLWLRRPF
jgi:hypothetical protein